MDLALNNLQRLICHKTQQTKPNQTKSMVLGKIFFNNQYKYMKAVVCFKLISKYIYIISSPTHTHLLSISVLI